MLLEEFVSETLKQIMSGVKAAQEPITEMGATVNPLGIIDPRSTDSRPKQPFVPQKGILHSVDFDVALTVAKGKKAKGGFAVVVAGFLGGGAHAQTEKSERIVSRVRFSVPVTYPPAET